VVRCDAVLVFTESTNTMTNPPSRSENQINQKLNPKTPNNQIHHTAKAPIVKTHTKTHVHATTTDDKEQIWCNLGPM
jgi:hypothetical protein